MSSSLVPWLAPQLRTLLTQNSPALLLQGPSGLGQWALGMALVRAWLCDRPSPLGACGSCESCHAIDVHSHSDLCLLVPQALQTSLGWPVINRIAQDGEDKERKPSRDIRIDDLREAIEFCQRTSARGRGKAVLIYPAERMNVATANALLKTLEEPPGEPGALRFVLASEAAHLLLPTIRSRCISHTMAWPQEVQSLAWLQQQGLGEKDAVVSLRAAGGRPETAWDAAQAGMTADQWAKFPLAIRQANGLALLGCTPAQATQRLQKLCHDLVAQRVGAPPRFFSRADLPLPPAKRHNGGGDDLAALLTWSKALVRSARIAEHPLNAQLMLESLAQQARLALDSYLQDVQAD
ncbi:MAG: DNA polymerase III subunit delta' [Burkholderiaceae bacterium]